MRKMYADLKWLIKRALSRYVDVRFNRIRDFLFNINPLARKEEMITIKEYEKYHTYPIPPYPLRRRIGVSTVEEFLVSGEHCFNDIRNALKPHGKDIGDFHAILDFGCGCGRTIRWLKDWAENGTLLGVDVDSEVVDWCSAHLPFVNTFQNNSNPPLPLQSDSFDLIYSISVFSHLEEANHIQWLEELARLLKPRGYATLSILGAYCYNFYSNGLPQRGLEEDQIIPDIFDAKKELDTLGYVFCPINLKESYGNTYISASYILKHWSTYFDIIDIIPVSMDRLQDTIVLQNK